MSGVAQTEANFVPPQQNPLLTRLIQSIFAPIAYLAYKLKIEVSEGDIAQLKAISHHRVVYLPNHSNLDDGLVMFLFSTLLGQLFYYVVAREAFQGWIGKLMQLVGSYSIRRGVGDRPSVVQTLKILQQPRAKLVIFPEGGCSYQNDTVIPFRPGALELSFKAMDKLAKQNKTVPDLYLVPISLKYTYPQAGDEQIEQALSGLETALSIQPQKPDFYERLRAIGEQVLTNLETEYQIEPGNLNDWNCRIDRLKQHLLSYCEIALELEPAIQLPNRERVYKVQAILRALDDRDKQPEIDYDHIYQTTVRLLNFDALHDGYVAAKPTLRRFFATLDRLEREVYKVDRPPVKGLQQIVIKVGTPINLKQHYQKAKRDRALAISQLTQTIQQTVQNNLQ